MQRKSVESGAELALLEHRLHRLVHEPDGGVEPLFDGKALAHAENIALRVVEYRSHIVEQGHIFVCRLQAQTALYSVYILVNALACLDSTLAVYLRAKTLEQLDEFVRIGRENLV